MKKRWTPRIIAIALVTTSSFATGAWGQQHGGHGASSSMAATSSGFPAQMHAAMAKMSKDMEAAPMTGDPDKDFLSMMIPHHEGAVEMARLVLVHGRDPLVRKLAEEIITAQQTEIATMRSRLEILKAGRDADPGGFPALGGTRGPDTGTSPLRH